MANKSDLAYSLLATSTLVIGLRLQELLLIVPGFLVLISIYFYYNSKTSIIGLAIGAMLLYPLPQMGWLYGRDSHRAAAGALQIMAQGWPTSGFAFTSTPLLHFHAALASIVTDLPIYPTTEPKILVTALLPIFYLGTTLLFIYISMRRMQLEVHDKIKPGYILPVLFWFPLMKFHSGFRRESIAIVFASAIIYLMYSGSFTWKRKFLFILFSFAIIVAHHFSSAATLLFVVTMVLLDRIRRTQSQAEKLTIFFSISFLSWYIVGGAGGSYIVGVIAGITPQVGDKLLKNEIQEPLFVIYQSFISLWLYQLLIGLCIVGGFMYSQYIKNIKYFEYSILYGVVMGCAAVVAWLGAPLAFNRILSFFVIASGILAPLGIHLFSQRILKANPKVVVRVFTFIILLLGVSMIPLHTISSAPPKYTDGQVSQRFNPAIYSASSFAGNYLHKKSYIGTLNIWGIIAVDTKSRVHSRLPMIERASVPTNAAVFLQTRNEKLYVSKRGKVNPDNLNHRFSEDNNGIYTNGDITIYSR
jgi:uncharacterized membrane protein